MKRVIREYDSKTLRERKIRESPEPKKKDFLSPRALII
jgi:hypothetical protein